MGVEEGRSGQAWKMDQNKSEEERMKEKGKVRCEWEKQKQREGENIIMYTGTLVVY